MELVKGVGMFWKELELIVTDLEWVWNGLNRVWNELEPFKMCLE